MVPNLLLIVSDQHRRDWMGCAGGPGAALVHTPHLDALAAQGLLAEAAYCASPLCGPSRMALMTGQAPHRLGIYSNEHTLRSDTPTFAHALGLAGYETVLCGRMHFSGLDQRHGFERRLVGDFNACYGGGAQLLDGDLKRESANAIFAGSRGRVGTSMVTTYDAAVTSAAEAFLAGRSDQRPLLLTVGLFQPHSPLVAPEADVAAALATMTPPLEAPLGHPALEERWAAAIASTPIAPDQVRLSRAVYAAMIADLDRKVGRILAAARHHLTGPTLVVYTSDHGEMAGDRGLWGKTLFFEAAVGVPFIAASLDGRPLPGCAIAPGTRTQVPLGLTDLAPTLAAVGGAPPMPGIDGRSLLPLFAGDSTALAGRAVRSEQCQRWVADGRLVLDQAPTRMVRRGPWKLTYCHPVGRAWSRATVLHRIDGDPDELHDLADDPVCRREHDELVALALDGWDPEAVARDANARAHEQAYTTAWGCSVGAGQLGRLEQFDPLRPGAVFGRPGVATGDLPC